MKINFALAELPDFKSLPGKALGPQHRGGIMIAPSLDYYDRAWIEARQGRPASRPFSQMVIQSATDPTVAPEGKHTLSLWCHHFPYAPAEGDIDAEREKIADRMTDILTELAPNFRGSVLARQIFLPVDIERVYGIEGGQTSIPSSCPSRYCGIGRSPAAAGTAISYPGFTCAAPARIPAATSTALPATTRLARFSAISPALN